MQNESQPSNNEARAEAAFERLGTRRPKCSVPGCNESDWRALTGKHPHILCYEHMCAEQGRSTVEQQHTLGRKIDPDMEVTMAGNDHRIMDSYKDQWPKETRENPDGSPALLAAAYLRVPFDWLIMIAKRYLEPVFLWLEALDSLFCEKLGRRWWVGLGLPDIYSRRVEQ